MKALHVITILCILLSFQFCETSEILITSPTAILEIYFPTTPHSKSIDFDMVNATSFALMIDDNESCNPNVYDLLSNIEVFFVSSSGCKLSEKINLMRKYRNAPLKAVVYEREIAAETRRPPGKGYLEPLRNLDDPIDFALVEMSYIDVITITEILNNITRESLQNVTDDPVLWITSTKNMEIVITNGINEWKIFYESPLFNFIKYFFVSVCSGLILTALYKLMTFILYSVKVKVELNDSFFILVIELVCLVLQLIGLLDIQFSGGFLGIGGSLIVHNLALVTSSMSTFFMLMNYIRLSFDGREIEDKSRLKALRGVRKPFIVIMSIVFAIEIVMVILSDRVFPVFAHISGTIYFWVTQAFVIATHITILVVGTRLDAIISKVEKNVGRKSNHRVLVQTLVCSIALLLIFIMEFIVFSFAFIDIMDVIIMYVVTLSTLLLTSSGIKVIMNSPVRESSGYIRSKQMHCGFFLPSAIKTVRTDDSTSARTGGSKKYYAQETTTVGSTGDEMVSISLEKDTIRHVRSTVVKGSSSSDENNSDEVSSEISSDHSSIDDNSDNSNEYSVPKNSPSEQALSPVTEEYESEQNTNHDEDSIESKSEN
jgi:hypothetical protein